MRKNLYLYKTSAGSFYIAEDNGSFLAAYEGESLSGYGTLQQATEDLAGGPRFLHRPSYIRERWVFRRICPAGSDFFDNCNNSTTQQAAGIY